MPGTLRRIFNIYFDAIFRPCENISNLLVLALIIT